MVMAIATAHWLSNLGQLFLGHISVAMVYNACFAFLLQVKKHGSDTG
jgi:hypothetical protein